MRIIVWLILNIGIWIATYFIQPIKVKNGDFEIQLLGSIFTTLLLIWIELEVFIVSKIRNALSLENKINQLQMSMTKNNNIRMELVASIENLIRIYDNEHIQNEFPKYASGLFKNESYKSITALNLKLQDIVAGEIKLFGKDCISTTIKCMEMVEKTVFAISFPDVNFWSYEGKAYFESNRHAVEKNNIE